ncbi:efflux RND transporter periplasmic adaptor subunit [Paraflavitalea sp. CAU 1676]|uniref:efflux RND transporter periplasmic adaptor subunit n=1 Tax=Paraflavitalea sp. CAU 1676 TaxID=3032598 RepID=UPI0023DC8063|nr:efflux RND transporter periplasmic adaptor subunit [Paraflavitalea sp. CAU 1676]MDF2188669.1 efflux RND transporter periplasmic adaptor subunit [Paraflavitalea sp. CAU 1676]
MERKRFIKTLAIFAMAPLLVLEACKEGNNNAVQQVKADQTYTCPMHPQIVQNKPGTCPICGMDLVPFDKNNKDAFLTLSESQVSLANVTTMTIGAGALSNVKQLNGRLATDPQKTVVISTRVPGRIEALYVRETGVKVNKGQPLYKIYSEQLATLQQEYLLSAAQARQFPEDARFQQIEKAARQKLGLYDQSEAQINQLLQAQKISPYVTYYAPSSGTVAELTIAEGQYAAEGSALMKLEGYGELWVEADIYPSEAGSLRVNQAVQVIVAGWENKPQTMTIQFINPSLQSGSQLLQVRGTIANPGNQWQPGQQVNILLPVKAKTDALTLPVDAVIRDGKGAHVWIETAKGKFEPRKVVTGMENFESVEIIEGLEAGDTVVITGAYLLYSEFILKKGADPMATHQH